MDHVLLVYKKSIYQIYIKEQRLSPANRLSDADLARLKASHDTHVATLTAVRQALTRRGIRFREVYRARSASFDRHDFVIAVGGDGTFIEASRRTTDQPLLGVNSDPARSVGFYCVATAATVDCYLDQLLGGQARCRRLNRMGLTLDGTLLDFHVLNDILVTHRSPAAMSCYRVGYGDVSERQRGSGMWVSTAAGSTGAIRSAGGSRMPLGSRRLQFLGRELFRGCDGPSWTLARGFVAAGEPLLLNSQMREGMVFVDGAHLRVPFPYGAELRVTNSAAPLTAVRALAVG
jgi:NAD+ kinase